VLVWFFSNSFLTLFDRFSAKFFSQGVIMRHIFLLALFILYVSCGQDKVATSSKTPKTGFCDLNGRSVACESIQEADGQGIDLLESVIEVPIKIENTDLTFLAEKSDISIGRRINCKSSVKNGEVYRFALREDRLLLMTGTGSYEMERLSDGEDINGAWMWKGYVEEGIHIIKSMAIVNNRLAIMRTTCEL
jgi:hypothetical protein